MRERWTRGVKFARLKHVCGSRDAREGEGGCVTDDDANVRDDARSESPKATANDGRDGGGWRRRSLGGARGG